MRCIGLDIGTTTISAVVLETPNKQLASKTIQSTGFLSSPNPWEKLQDAESIAQSALELVRQLSKQYAPIAAIGLTGQMHGILYVDSTGHAVSPLYTWQDERGNLPAFGGTFAQNMSQSTGYPLATGYGMVTHAWNIAHGVVPLEAKSFTTISTYVGMRLTGRAAPILHISDAASLGCYQPDRHAFDTKALSSVGISADMLPQIASGAAFLGIMPSGTLVTVGIGDNQASFLGSARDAHRSILLNIGTGGQISALADTPAHCPDVEERPFLDTDFLLVGSPLCAGRAYALLEKFFRECAQMAGADVSNLYERMNALAGARYAHPLKVSTLFSGKRSNPSLRGSIENLGEENFTPGHLIRGVLEGIAEELYQLYAVMKPHIDPKADRLIASGNAVRMNPALRDILAERFGMPVELPETREEAATGAAVFAYMAAKNSR